MTKPDFAVDTGRRRDAGVKADLMGAHADRPDAEPSSASSFALASPGGKTLLYTVVAVLVVLWLIGLIGHIGGGLIHALLVIAGIVFVFQLVTGRRKL